MTREHRKSLGAYYTPREVAATLVRWAVRRPEDRLLDPACGDGRFLAHHPNSVGVDCDPAAIAEAAQAAPGRAIREADFFEWALSRTERFDCAAGNPPFIRYQRFNGLTRELALRICGSLGAQVSRLTSSWVPYLIVTASLLRKGGRIAFVVPAEIGHAPYAAPLLSWLADHFGTVRVVAIRKKVFRQLSEDVWLLPGPQRGNGVGLRTPYRLSGGAGGPRPAIRVHGVSRGGRATLAKRVLPHSGRLGPLDAAPPGVTGA